MKNKRFKKALSVFLSMLMLMSCWVWVAPTDAAAANKYYVKVYVNIYDGSDGYGGTYSVEESTGKPKNYSWATNDGWYGRVNMTGFTVFGEKGDYDAQDVSTSLLEAEKLNVYYAMSGLSDNNKDGDWDSKRIAQEVYTFTLDSFPIEVFWINDENNWDGGNTGFAIRKLTVATSENGVEHTMWEGLAGSDSQTYNYYGSITPTGIHTCFEDYAKNYDMNDYKFYKAITTSSQRQWTDPYTYGSAGTYYLNEYANGGVSATFSEGTSSVASTVDYIDTSSSDTYYVNFTNHSKTQAATITGIYNNGSFITSPADSTASDPLEPGETRSFEINKSKYGSLAKYNGAANFTFEYTLSNVYATTRLNEIITEINGILNEKPDFTGYDASHDEYEDLVTQSGDKIKDDVAGKVNALDTIVEGVRGDETATKIEDQGTVDNAKTQLDAIINGINDGSLRDPDYSAVENKINEAKGNDNLNKDTQDKIKEIEEELQKIKDKTEPEANAKDDQDDVNALKDKLDKILESITNGTAKAPDYTNWDAAEDVYDEFTAEELQNVKTEILDEVTALKNTINTLKADPTANAKDDQKTVNDSTTRLNQIIEGINNGSLLNPDDGECKHTSTEYIVDNSNGDKLSTHSLKCKACGEILSTEACTFTTKTVEATCHSEGYTVYSCTVCSYGFRADFTEMIPHTYSNWQLVEISCTEVATMTRECIVEGCLAQESKPAKDENGKPVYGMHTLVVVEGKAATCLNDGYTDYTYCVVCNKRTDSTVLPATGHKDDNHNGNCDLCSRPMNPTGHCSCFCHGDSFFEKLLFRIINFFWKLFKINRNCDCGANHW